MFDLKVMNSVLGELEEERGIPKEKVVEAIEAALATAYKKEYAKKGQIIRTAIGGISVLGRATQGVRVMKMKEGDEIASITTL